MRSVLGCVVSLLLVAGAAGCRAAHWSAPKTSQDDIHAMTPVEMDVAEAAFRQLFQRNESDRQLDAYVYCLAWHQHVRGQSAWTDPPGELVHRLSNVKVAVRARSACKEAQQGMVYDGSPDRRGVVFYLTSIDCRTPTECTVVGGYQAGMDNSSGFTLGLVKRGPWVVVEHRMDWIS